MEIISFWLFTQILSEGLRFQTELRILKDLADNGFKVTNTENNIYFDMKPPEDKQYLFLRRFLPGINIIDAMEKMVEYKNTRNVLVDSFLIRGSIGLMTDYEQKVYEENPTALNAFKINFKSDMKINNAKQVTLDDGTEVWFDFGREKHNKDEIVIYKSIGQSSRESIKTQKSLVLNTLQYRLKKDIEDSKQKEISKQKENNKESESNYRKNKIEALEAMKKTLLDGNKKIAERQKTKKLK